MLLRTVFMQSSILLSSWSLSLSRLLDLRTLIRVRSHRAGRSLIIIIRDIPSRRRCRLLDQKSRCCPD